MPWITEEMMINVKLNKESTLQKIHDIETQLEALRLSVSALRKEVQIEVEPAKEADPIK